MPNVREITTTWTTPSTRKGTSVMYFDASISATTQRTALGLLWFAVKAAQASTASYVIETTGREMDSGTGVLTGAWTEATAHAGTGTGGSVAVPDATQLILQWLTASILGGRFLRGRTFIPGCST